MFAPAALLREARRQKGLSAANVPSVCILDPDGRLIKTTGQARRSDTWPCYHTELHAFELQYWPLYYLAVMSSMRRVKLSG